MEEKKQSSEGSLLMARREVGDQLSFCCGLSWVLETGKKKAVSKEEAKPINGLNPGQLHLQQNFLAVGNADSRA